MPAAGNAQLWLAGPGSFFVFGFFEGWVLPFIWCFCSYLVNAKSICKGSWIGISPPGLFSIWNFLMLSRETCFWVFRGLLWDDFPFPSVCFCAFHAFPGKLGVWENWFGLRTSLEPNQTKPNQTKRISLVQFGIASVNCNWFVCKKIRLV